MEKEKEGCVTDWRLLLQWTVAGQEKGVAETRRWFCGWGWELFCLGYTVPL